MSSVYPTTIVLKNLTYTVEDVNKKKKTVLYNIDIAFKPSRLSVIVGPSGSGKTTLMSIIAGLLQRESTSSLTGATLFNNESLGSSDIRKLAGFVFQDDVLLATMTAREAIRMSVVLRLPKLESAEEQKLVDDILEMTQLSDVADTLIGSSLKKGLSGGQRKRVAIAMELVSNPSVLLLDEPTSGLDTFTAYKVTKLLKDLAEVQHRLVVTTLHQPSSEIFHLIDDLVVLNEGVVVYAGPAKNLVKYFSDIGYRFSAYSNPADVLFMSVLNNGITDLAEYNDPTPVDQLSSYFYKSQTYENEYKPILTDTRISGINRRNFKYKAPVSTTFKFLIRRDIRNIGRNPLVLKTKVIQTFVLAAFIALFFQKSGSAAPPAVYQNIAGVLFFLVINAFFASFNNVLPVFGTEKITFLREYSQGYYTLTPYFMSKLLVELPFTMIFPVISTVIVYWIIGLRSGLVHFVVVCIGLIVVAVSGFSFAVLAASIFNDVNIALAASILFILPAMLLGGLFLNIATLPVYLKWMQWLSPMRYAYSGILSDQFVGSNGETYYNDLGIDNGFSLWLNFLFVILLSFSAVLVAYFALWRTVANLGKSKKSLLSRLRSK